MSSLEEFDSDEDSSSREKDCARSRGLRDLVERREASSSEEISRVPQLTNPSPSCRRDTRRREPTDAKLVDRVDRVDRVNRVDLGKRPALKLSNAWIPLARVLRTVMEI